MANTGETLDQRAKQAAADAKSGAAEFADTARERAREMAEEARERAYEYGRGYKDEAANETSKIAEALRKAADDLHDGSPQERVFARLADAVARECREETGLDVVVGEPVEIVERFGDGRGDDPPYHFVIIDFAVRVVGGTLAPADDVAAARWVEWSELGSLPLTDGLQPVLERARAGDKALAPAGRPR